ncbi:DUF732 domain-containing protein [Candidatus Mycobacterium methanotrophicum]|uniref:DUF732 domain-containing protein n=1 Tax=Candidatus Mycobacterium methanotrophicum TaxID=2943498 RepID=A0ABY4QGL7_9MYCO|nr:DUF732 domain-containing protein [Candidatus Mycobacterium methanotrophicum]UQX10108.1 DUF732 domain-containing protein [Candidatus Mycobacterium methanotrophicum]
MTLWIAEHCEDVGWGSGALALDFDFVGHDVILAALSQAWFLYDNGAAISDDGQMRRLLLLLGIIATVGSGVPAHADPAVDASFLDALTKAGITFSNGPSAVNAGKAACGLMDQGQPEIDVVQHVTEQNPGISMTSAAKFTAIAASAYCPQHLQRASDNGAEPPPNRADISGGRGE